MILPTLGDKIKPFTTQLPYQNKKETRYLANEEYAEFWEAAYQFFRHKQGAQFPVRYDNIEQAINPYFGFFGYRVNPLDHTQKVFHSGIDIESKKKTECYPVFAGILEYAGYGVINGNYVMMSHPQIISEDGFMLYSFYMHLRTTEVGFTSYQKMLREISLRTYPRISLNKETMIGTVGDTGVQSYPDEYTHVHVQLEMRNKDGVVIMLDPAKIFGLHRTENMTRDLHTTKEFTDIYVRNRKDILDRHLESVWAPYRLNNSTDSI